MSFPDIEVEFPVPFPASVVGDGGIKVVKVNGMWTIHLILDSREQRPSRP